MYYTKPDGTLYFHDEGKKFIQEKHGLTNLISNHDICVYSLTPKGHTTPAWLIVKVTMAKCMDQYLVSDASFPERCVSMTRMDYERSSPMNLFSRVKGSKGIFSQNIRDCSPETDFLECDRFGHDAIDITEFFSIEVDPDSNEEGAKIYLRDKAHFTGADNK